MNNTKIDDSIIEKIQKLLNLAESDNENEARVATNKASELLARYNLSLQEVRQKDFLYTSTETNPIGRQVSLQHKYISTLITRYFFVKVIVMSKVVKTDSNIKDSFERSLRFVGTKENCSVALEVFNYLDKCYLNLWRDYNKQNNKSYKSKPSFFRGISAGIEKTLIETRSKIQVETGLLIVADQRLERHIAKMKLDAYNSVNTNGEFDEEAYKVGFEEGQNLDIAPENKLN